MKFEIDADTLVTCPMDDCGKTSKGWENTEVHCDDCGDHPGVECPACDTVIDTVHHDLADMIVTECLTVQGSGADLIHASVRFERGSVVEVCLQPVLAGQSIADWSGWED